MAQTVTGSVGSVAIAVREGAREIATGPVPLSKTSGRVDVSSSKKTITFSPKSLPVTSSIMTLAKAATVR